MKNILFLITYLVMTIHATAQETKKQVADSTKTVVLNEVTVAATKTIDKPDGTLYIPSIAQTEASKNGYGLLAKLHLPQIRIDEALHTITALNHKGYIQIRINGIISSEAELLSMNPKLVKSVHFIDNPGVRYGEDVGYVIDIKTIKTAMGGSVGIHLSNSLTAINGKNAVYAKTNYKNSEFSLNYTFGYRHFKHIKENEIASFLFNDNTIHTIEHHTTEDRTKFANNSIELKYNLADSASYVFQATLSADFQHRPNNYQRYDIVEEGSFINGFSNITTKSLSPSLDLYFFHKLSKQQSITANVVGTKIQTNSRNELNEGEPYLYNVKGNTYSLFSELIYENQLKPFTLSVGLNNSLKYFNNEYTHDVLSINKMHHTRTYFFTEIKKQWDKWGYSLGMGLANVYYTQGASTYNYWLPRPKLSLNYHFNKQWSVRYSFEMSDHVSQIAMISDTKVRTSKMEWNVGNPNIRPSRRIEQFLTLSYNSPRMMNNLVLNARLNHRPNMGKYVRTADNQFLYIQDNQRYIHMFYANNNTTLRFIPDVLEASIGVGVYRFINKGDDYTHNLTAFNGQIGIDAYLGKWTISAYVDNGWSFIEGERKADNLLAAYIGASYQVGNCMFSLYIQNPFMHNPTLSQYHLLNQYVKKDHSISGKEFGNLINFSFSWNMDFGRKGKETRQRQTHKDTDTGIM